MLCGPTPSLPLNPNAAHALGPAAARALPLHQLGETTDLTSTTSPRPGSVSARRLGVVRTARPCGYE